MSHSYEQSSYLASPYSFEAVKNPETDQLRPMAGINTFYKFQAGAMDANGVIAWAMLTDILLESFWVIYPGTPDGTVTVTLFNPLGTAEQSLIINTANNGETFDNAWAYRFSAPFAIPKGWSARFKPSVAISSVTGYGQPCLFFDNQLGLKVS